MIESREVFKYIRFYNVKTFSFVTSGYKKIRYK